MSVKFTGFSDRAVFAIGALVVFSDGALGVLVVGARGAVKTTSGVERRSIPSCVASLTGTGCCLGGLVVVRANRTSCAGGSSGGVGVVTLRTSLAGGSGGLISVVAFWAELTAIGGVSSFVQTWSARHADPVIDSGSGEGGGDAGVEAPPWIVLPIHKRRTANISIPR